MLLCGRGRWGASGSSTGGPLAGGSGRGQVAVPSLPWASCTTEAAPAGSGSGSASRLPAGNPRGRGHCRPPAQCQAVLPVTKRRARGRQATRRALRLSPPKPGPVARFSREESRAQTPAGRRRCVVEMPLGPGDSGQPLPPPILSMYIGPSCPFLPRLSTVLTSHHAQLRVCSWAACRSRLREGGCVRGLGPATHPGPPSAVAAHLCPCSVLAGPGCSARGPSHGALTTGSIFSTGSELCGE